MTDRTTASETSEVLLDLSRSPSMAHVFIKAVTLSLTRSQGRLNASDPPVLTVKQSGLKPNPERIRLFAEVCQDRKEHPFLPLVYPETLFIGMMGKIITAPCFPLSPMGLIHTGQTIVQHRPIGIDELLDARCSTTRMAVTERGVEVDCILELKSGDETVWEGLVTFLSRDVHKLSGKKKKKAGRDHDPLPALAVLDVPDNTGRRYAAASGDYNPHHLYRATAKLLGFRRPIAHGMWSLARSIAELEKHHAFEHPVRLSASFKLPVFMPARVILGCAPAREKEDVSPGLTFELTDAVSGVPHLTGIIG